jgi:hypothetical protein
MLSHNSATCRRCEAVPPDVYRRHWKREEKASYWHTIADDARLMANLPHDAHFVTMLAYQLGQDESQASYRGPLYWEFDADDPTQTLEDLRRCLHVLELEYGCPLEAVHISHSGGRGYHVTIPPIVFGAEAGNAQLPRIYAMMIERLFPASVAPTLDRGVYSSGKGRMWRLPNRRRSDTGRYKVPVSMREALHKSSEQLEALTMRSRKGIFWPAEAELSPCPGLVQLYQEIVADVERNTASPRHPSRASAHPSGDTGVLFHAFGDRGWLGHEIEAGKWAVQCPWEALHTKGERLDTSTVLFAPSDGKTLGWFHCSHAHCQGRDVRDVLSVFTEFELVRARQAAGLPTVSGMSGRWPSHLFVEVR